MRGNPCEPCALSISTLAMVREKDLSPRVALAPPESCDFSASTIATRTPERRTTRLHSDTFRNAIHSFQSFSGHNRKHGLDRIRQGTGKFNGSNDFARSRLEPSYCQGREILRWDESMFFS